MNKLSNIIAKVDATTTVDEARIAVEASITRKCGRCTGCCTALGVDAVGKKDMERCVHELKHKGCAIYADRPAQCRNFFCLWKLGFGTRKDAPDQIGVVFDGYIDDAGRAVLRAAEVRAGAMEPGTRGAALGEQLAGTCDRMLILHRSGMRTLRVR